MNISPDWLKKKQIDTFTLFRSQAQKAGALLRATGGRARYVNENGEQEDHGAEKSGFFSLVILDVMPPPTKIATNIGKNLLP